MYVRSNLTSLGDQIPVLFYRTSLFSSFFVTRRKNNLTSDLNNPAADYDFRRKAGTELGLRPAMYQFDLESGGHSHLSSQEPKAESRKCGRSTGDKPKGRPSRRPKQPVA
jgi:hypothetical protein